MFDCRPVRLNITQFATEQSYDWVYILQQSIDGFQSILQKLSGNLSQASVQSALLKMPFNMDL